MRSNTQTQIFGDGKTVAFIWKEQSSKAEMAYIFKDAIITKITVEESERLPDIPLLFGERKVVGGYQPAPTPIKATLDLECEAGNTIKEYNENGGLLQDMDLFKNISVSKMFKIINKKLIRRESKWMKNFLE